MKVIFREFDLTGVDLGGFDLEKVDLEKRKFDMKEKLAFKGFYFVSSLENGRAPPFCSVTIGGSGN